MSHGHHMIVTWCDISNWTSDIIDTVFQLSGINRNYSSYYPSLGLALIRTIKIGTENFRNDEISWNFKIFKCISHYFIFVPISCLERIRNIKFLSYDHSKIMWFRNKFRNHRIYLRPKKSLPVGQNLTGCKYERSNIDNIHN